MRITYYREDPETLSSVQYSGTDESITKLREVLAHAIALSGRDHWLWKPGALFSMHADADGITCAWRDNRAMAKYNSYIDAASDAILGERSDVEHVLAECRTDCDYPPAADQVEGDAQEARR